MRILLVEDDAQIGHATQLGFNQVGYAVDWVKNGLSAVSAAATHHYHCILLDLGLPQLDGMSVLKKLRLSGFEKPILIITARDEVSQRILGLDEGADDFIVKPFDFDELAARVRAAMRRAAGRSQEIIRSGNITINAASRSVERADISIALTPKEFAILMDLMTHLGQVRLRHQLEDSLYQWGAEVESNAIQVHIHHLRKKLGQDFISTIHGVGYSIGQA